MTRKIVQLTPVLSRLGIISLFAVCDDGTIWCFMYDEAYWRQLQSVPQP